MDRLHRSVRGGALRGLAVARLITLAGLPGAARSDDATALAERIDRHLAARQAADGVKPTRPADDAEFLRRVSLDLGGRIPRLNVEMQEWLTNKSPNKRR